MPERPLTIATYAVGASLCAISLFYVFGPGFPFDEDPSASKRRIVGLQNPHNLCFCNSVLQALANSPGLRKYLIRELHRRKLDGFEVYQVEERDVPGRGREAELKRLQLQKLQDGIVTQALKAMLDRLNERPLHKKTISAAEFLSALESAFRTRISTDQQDAQEFLQIVLERLCDEYHAGEGARQKFRDRSRQIAAIEEDPIMSKEISAGTDTNGTPNHDDVTRESPIEDIAGETLETGDDFPFEGQTESELECQYCMFKPKPAVSNFVTLTLNVPHISSTTLNECFDGVFKQEIIEGYRCDKCRLVHARDVKQRQLERSADEKTVAKLQSDLDLIEAALEEDPERELKDANLPNDAPKRTIRKVVRISRFPKVLAIHLSRSLYSATSLSTKNTARVTFPDGLQVGGILDPHRYRLASVITHKGGHNSGHYETFRRQYNSIPMSTASSLGTHGVYSRQASPNPSSIQFRPSSSASTRPSKDFASPPLQPVQESSLLASPASPEPSFLDVPQSMDSPQSTPRSSLSLSAIGRYNQSRPSTSTVRDSAFISPTIFSEKSPSTGSVIPAGAANAAKLQKRQKKLISRWWRVSDEKVKDSKTSDVLGMQKEVYLLFYEAET